MSSNLYGSNWIFCLLLQLTAALVIPSDNKVRDIFVALALEAGYNMPGGIADLQPPPDTPINVRN